MKRFKSSGALADTRGTKVRRRPFPLPHMAPFAARRGASSRKWGHVRQVGAVLEMRENPA
ncbi:hypothetical protein GCM10025876_27780 [Demequina litorisediminis]|uniref:Uncharacterized protein n=1 Tax=Demequina litorisediminis TaxID=1849022 RepID=A0ABQ6IFQ5_9MICO|nr:hypothetical protein GCM10025876_27780 [Demequina litorisediminis]